MAGGWRWRPCCFISPRVRSGLPVFAGTPAKGIGLPYMLGPTGGYLVGFVAAAGIAGWVAQRSRHWLATVGGLLAGTAAIYLLGAGWLADLRRGGEGGDAGCAALPLGRRGQAGPGRRRRRGRAEAAAGLSAEPHPAGRRRGDRRGGTAPAAWRARGLPDRDRLRAGCGRHQRRARWRASTAPRAARRTTP